MLTKNFPLIIGLLIFVQACAPTLPMLKENNLKLPKKYPSYTDASSSSKAKLGGMSAAEVNWKEFFGEQNLGPLIETALKSNIELALREQEVFITNNEIMSRQGKYFPVFRANANGGVEKAERFSTEDANEPIKFSRYGVSASWEIDIWKKLRNASKSAYYKYLSTIEGRRFVVTGVVSEVANTYFELMALDNQLQIIESYVGILSQIKQMVQLQQTAGRTTSLAVKRFDAEVLKNQARLYNLQQKIVVTENKLNTLLGRFPRPIKRNPKKFLDIAFVNVKASVPSQLLENRPDIRSAMNDLEAAKLDVSVAKARFYPALSIDGEYGYEQFNGKHFDGTANSVFYGLAAGLSAPLLNRQGIKAEYFSANNKQIQAIYNYEFSLINAYAEVSNQLSKVKNFNKMFDLKQKEVKALTESINISNMLFRAARVDYIEALFTQRDALEAQLELIEVKKDQLMASVDLYKALGGGWKGLSEGYESNY